MKTTNRQIMGKRGRSAFLSRTVQAFVLAAVIGTTAMPSLADAKEAKLVCAGYTGTTALENFQALVKLPDGVDGFSYADLADSTTGSDIWFTDAGGTVIPHEIDTWNASGTSLLWVKIPALESSSTSITMHWGDASGKQTTTDNVWPNFVGVWHMNETGTTAEPDSTANGLDATPLNTSDAATSINTTAGIVGTGRANGNNQHLTVGSSTKSYWGDGRLTDTTKFSISGWFQWAADSTHPRFVSAGISGSDLNTWEIFYFGNSGAAKVLRVRSGDGSGNHEVLFGNTSIPLRGSYVYLTVVWDGANVSVYKDGTPQTTTGTAGGARSNSNHKNKFEIGGFGNTGDRSFIGSFDEVRMYDGAMTADRAAADYKTMNAPAEFLVTVADDTIVRAVWTGAANDGDVANAANWTCYNSSGSVVAGVPSSATAVTVSGSNLNFQVPATATFEYLSLTFGNCTLGVSCDWRGLGAVTIPSGVTIDLKGYALLVKGLAGAGSIVSTANATYTTLDYIQADNTDASQYIVTDYTPRYSDTFITKVNFQNRVNQCIYCARGGSVGSGSYSCLTYGAGEPLRFDHVATMGTYGVAPAPALDTDCEFIVNGKTGLCKLNGAVVYAMATSDDDAATAASALSFFVLNNSASGTALAEYGQANFKMYLFRIYSVDGKLVRDYVPAKNGGGVVGLWDRAGNVFWPSAGGTAFIAGNETGRGELVFHVPSGETGSRSGVTIASSVKVVKEGEGSLADGKMNVDTTPVPEYSQREGTVNFTPPSSDYTALGPDVYYLSGGTFGNGSGNFQLGRAELNGGTDHPARFVQSGGTVNFSEKVFMGVRTTGTYDISGGSLTCGGVQFFIGYSTDGLGRINITGGSLTTGSSCDFVLGEQPGGSGQIVQSAGTVTLGKILFVGNNATGTSSYTLTDGALTVASYMQIGAWGAGTFTQGGGTAQCDSYLSIARNVGVAGTYTMTGGTYSSPNQYVIVGEEGAGTLDVSGTAVMSLPHGVSVGQNTANASGTVNLHGGGKIRTASIWGGAGSASVMIDGGTLETTADGDILKNITDVTIGAGGLALVNAYTSAITNTTLKVAAGTTAITMTGEGTLDLSNATVELTSRPTRAFDFAATETGTFTGVPTLTGECAKGCSAKLLDNGRRCRISRRGGVIIVR